MATKSYTVMRHLAGDRNYVPGDTRELDPHEAAPLLASGAIVEGKADRAPKSDKAEKAAPQNKRG